MTSSNVLIFSTVNPAGNKVPVASPNTDMPLKICLTLIIVKDPGEQSLLKMRLTKNLYWVYITVLKFLSNEHKRGRSDLVYTY